MFFLSSFYLCIQGKIKYLITNNFNKSSKVCLICIAYKLLALTKRQGSCLFLLTNLFWQGNSLGTLGCNSYCPLYNAGTQFIVVQQCNRTFLICLFSSRNEPFARYYHSHFKRCNTSSGVTIGCMNCAAVFTPIFSPIL